MNKSWEDITLNDLITFVIGGDWGEEPDKTSNNEYINAYCIRGAELRNWRVEKGSTASLRSIKISSIEKRKLQEGDIILEISGGGPDQPVGRTAYIDFETLSNYNGHPVVCTNFFRLLRITEYVNKKFIDYYFQYFYCTGDVVLYQGGSNNLRNLKFNDYISIKVPLPPLNEQNRIVEKLDRLFAKIDSINESIENIPELIKQFRQSVLHAAVTGKLTEEWRMNFKNQSNAVEFVEEISKKRKNRYNEQLKNAKTQKIKKPLKDYEFVYDSHSQINNWAVVKLEQLIYIAARIGWRGLKASEYTQSGPMFLSVHALNNGDKVDFSKAYHISEERYVESSEIMLRNHDILLCKDGAGIGKMGYVEELNEKATVNSSLLIIRSQEAFYYKFLYYYFCGPKLQTIVKERMTGSAVPHLFQRDIKEFFIEMPPLEEQYEIVRQIELLFSLVEGIESRYLNFKDKLKKLPQAILAKAFRGELVSQDPNDEPAEQLLQLILEEKAKLEGKTKKLVKKQMDLAAEPEGEYKSHKKVR